MEFPSINRAFSELVSGCYNDRWMKWDEQASGLEIFLKGVYNAFECIPGSVAVAVGFFTFFPARTIQLSLASDTDKAVSNIAGDAGIKKFDVVDEVKDLLLEISQGASLTIENIKYTRIADEKEANVTFQSKGTKYHFKREEVAKQQAKPLQSQEDIKEETPDVSKAAPAGAPPPVKKKEIEPVVIFANDIGQLRPVKGRFSTANYESLKDKTIQIGDAFYKVTAVVTGKREGWGSAISRDERRVFLEKTYVENDKVVIDKPKIIVEEKGWDNGGCPKYDLYLEKLEEKPKQHDSPALRLEHIQFFDNHVEKSDLQDMRGFESQLNELDRSLHLGSYKISQFDRRFIAKILSMTDEEIDGLKHFDTTKEFLKELVKKNEENHKLENKLRSLKVGDIIEVTEYGTKRNYKLVELGELEENSENHKKINVGINTIQIDYGKASYTHKLEEIVY